MGNYYLQWKDRHGNYHNITSMEENNCNRNWPQMLTDTTVLEDRSLLPITGRDAVRILH